MLLKTHTGREVQLLTALGKGGEGEVYAISGDTANVAKLYNQETLTKRPYLEQKIDYLVKHPPALKDTPAYKLIWPYELLFREHQPGAAPKFCGYLMPKAEGESFEMLLHKNRYGNHPVWKKLASPQGKQQRLQLLSNLWLAMNAIHASGHYVLVDSKPANLIVSDTDCISVVDLDAVQIWNQQQAIFFPAYVATEDYMPSEGRTGQEISQLKIEQSWDYFSLAVLSYRFLVGLHPFTGSLRNKSKTTLGEAIHCGAYANGSHWAAYFETRPPLHDCLAQDYPEFQRAFLETFESGHACPALRWSPSRFRSILYPQPVFTVLPNIQPGWAIKGQEVEISWKVEQADEVEVETVGLVQGDRVLVKPEHTRAYYVKARNQFGETCQDVQIPVFAYQPPDIKMPEFKVSLPYLNTSLVKQAIVYPERLPVFTMRLTRPTLPKSTFISSYGTLNIHEQQYTKPVQKDISPKKQLFPIPIIQVAHDVRVWLYQRLFKGFLSHTPSSR